MPSTRLESAAEDGRGPAKRRRVSRACDQCRTAREKCDGAHPECFRCSSQKRTCTYEASPKKRGVQTGYIRSLEVGLAWIFEHIPGSEGALNEAIKKGTDGRPKSKIERGKDALFKRWKRSTVRNSVEQKLPGKVPDTKLSPLEEGSESEEDHESIKSNRHDSDLGTTGAVHSTASPSNQPVFNQAAEGATCGSGRGKRPLTTLGLEQQKPGRHGRASGSALHLSLPPNHWRLIDVYFAFTHCWLPIVEKHALLKTTYSYSAGKLDLNVDEPTSANHAELWGVLTLACFQDSASSNAAASRGSEVPTASPAILSPQDCYNIALSLIPSPGADFKVQHVRTLLLLSLIDIGRGQNSRAWLMIGKAVRIALLLRLHQHPNSMVSRLDRRSYMGCFVLDTICSILLKLPPHIRPDPETPISAPPVDDLDEWQPWTGCAEFGSSGNISHARSPAHSMTIFNQLHRIVTTLNICTAQRSGAMGWGSHLGGLKASFHTEQPFGEFLMTGVTTQPRPPSAFLARLTLLMGQIIFGTHSVATTIQFIENLKQICSLFGVSSTPSLVTAYISIIEYTTKLDGLAHEEIMWLESFKRQTSEVWTGLLAPTSLAFLRSSNETSPEDGMQPPTEVNKISSSCEQNTNTLSTAYQAPIIIPHVSQHITSSPSSGPAGGQPQSFLDGGGDSGGLPGQQPPQPGSSHGPSPRHQHQHSPGARFSEMGGGMVLGNATGPPQASANHIAMGAMTAPVDYDALLDELSMIESTERPDLDTQFMANLGFAPGSDLNDVLAYGFGAQNIHPDTHWQER
ncbi:hypothetical protein MKZ38_005977 [Zalerion maritima]|uniref:Zn(2)-C6 fungal-type domain-containing protein n=1 Tax=Zalerion maritima TaxID=339359 RepID=A0AAD5WQ16_9PEZI|nr:hypothetical protein MKZ38_005977 [Zalerion maritima]